MPAVQSENQKVIAIVCADLHLSLSPPPARAKEFNWFDAMARPLGEMGALAVKHNCPILCAGDLFDKWAPPPELINFVIDVLPGVIYAIPGQHDLPYHSKANIEQCAFQTLVKAGKIKHVPPEGMWVLSRGTGTMLRVYGFGWCEPIEHPKDTKTSPRIALVHEYTWINGAGYPNAREDQKPDGRRYKGYDAVIIGDNHKPWDILQADRRGKIHIFNCGGFFNRKSDELHHPRIGLLMEDCTIHTHLLDTSKNSFNPAVKGLEEGVDSRLAEFLTELHRLQGTSLDFRETIIRAMDAKGTSPDVRRWVMQSLELQLDGLGRIVRDQGLHECY